MKSKQEEIEQLRSIFTKIKEEAERDGYIDMIFSEDLLREMVYDINNDIAYSDYRHLRDSKTSLQKANNDLDAEIHNKRIQVTALNSQVHDLSQKLFRVKDSIRRLAHEADK